MRGGLLFPLLAPAVLLLPTCNGGQQAADAGSDADAGADQGDGYHPAQFVLEIEPDARACGLFHQFRTWQQEIALLGCVTFRAGSLELPADVDTFDADLVDRIAFGPDRVEPVPAGPGGFVHAFEHGGDPRNGCHRYTFQQAFAIDDLPYNLEMRLSFCLQDGVAGKTSVRIDEDFSPEIDGMTARLGDGADVETQWQFFGPCLYLDLPRYQVTAEVEGGDRMVLEKRLAMSVAGTGPANITSAEVDIEGTTRATDDYFHLVYAADHHNWNERFVVLLEPPIGDVHGLLLARYDYWQDPIELVYLDAELGELARKPLTLYRESSR